MRRLWMGLCFLMASGVAQSAELISVEFVPDQARPRPVFEEAASSNYYDLIPGLYESASPTYLKNVRITSWAGREWILSGLAGEYAGRWVDVSVDLYSSSSEQNVFNGRGTLVARYNTMTCSYPFYVKLFAEQDGFYVRQRQQRTLCVHNCTTCWPTELSDARNDHMFMRVGN